MIWFQSHFVGKLWLAADHYNSGVKTYKWWNYRTSFRHVCYVSGLKLLSSCPLFPCTSLSICWTACCPSSEHFGSVEKVCESEHRQAHLSLYSFLCWNFGSYHTLLPNRTGSFVNKKGLQFTPNSLSCFMFLWPCIVSKAWWKNTNKTQQYRWFIVNCRCWLLTTVSTCFGHLYAHHQEKRRVTAYGVYLLVVLDVAGCGTVVLRWGCDHCEGCCSTQETKRICLTMIPKLCFTDKIH